uniref:Endonuclease/exonuclease/phosphatase domain-containing protein n=1 Tax=Trichogramma kaykai TaxID=54128 RepID=A0ABD2WHJ7_9HYME
MKAAQNDSNPTNEKENYENIEQSQKMNSESFNDNKVKPPLQTAQYRSGIPGPYSVWIRSKTANREISQFKVGSLIFKKYPNITDICKRSRSKVEVVLLSRVEANSLALYETLGQHGMKAYIPGFRKTSKGIIRGIDIDFTEEQLLEGIMVPGLNQIKSNSPIQINSEKQVDSNESVTENSKGSSTYEWVPTKSIVCTFEGQNLPDKVYLWGLKRAEVVKNVLIVENHSILAKHVNFKLLTVQIAYQTHQIILKQTPISVMNKENRERTYASTMTIKNSDPGQTSFKEMSDNNPLSKHNTKPALQTKLQQQKLQLQQQQQQKSQQQQKLLKQHHEQQHQPSQQQPSGFNKNKDGLSQLQNSTSSSLITLQNTTQKLFNRLYNESQDTHEFNNKSLLKDDDVYKLKGYNVVRYDRTVDKGGGIAFLIKSHIKYEIVEHNLNLDLIEIGIISFETHWGVINLIAYYRSPTHITGSSSVAAWQKDWDSLIKKISEYQKFIFLGDFNAHNSWWGSNHTCSYGNYMQDNLDPAIFTLLNNGLPTHVTITGNEYSTSHIDLTFVSSSLNLDISNWQVLDDTWDSDHFPIETSILTQAKKFEKLDYRYNLRKLNWDSFFIELEQIKSMPKIRNNSKNVNFSKNNQKPSCCWWNDNCERAIRTRKAKLKSLEYHCNLEKFIEFKKIRAITRRTLKNEKKIHLLIIVKV